MEISPNVVEQNKIINYKMTLKKSSYIESIDIYSKNDYFHNDKIEYTIENNEVLFSYAMPHIGEFIVKVHLAFDGFKESEMTHLYCLDKDIIKLKPFKGDLHMHTIYSDGKRTPLAMTLHSLSLGLDLISITDHDFHHGAQDAISKVKKFNIDMLVLPGEEVTVGKEYNSPDKQSSHSSGNGHMLSINANKSIEKQRENKVLYAKELDEIAKNISKDLIGKNIDPHNYARNIWAINKVKEANGIAILCHPNWVYHNAKYHLHQPLYKELLENSNIDGVEVIGDINGTEEHNNMGYLTYLKSKNKHKQLAPFGNTDAHDIEHDARERFSIFFAKEKTTDGIVDAINAALTCAVVRREDDEHQIIGDDSLAHYSYFLIKEYFPKHKHLRNKLSKLYIDQLINDESFEDKINIVKKRLKEHQDSFFSN